MVNEEANFSVSIDCDATIESVVWSFGDGHKGKGATTSHVYKDVGEFTVRVTVTAQKTITNEEGESETITETDTASKKITIKGKLELQANPEVIPVNTGSTTISAKVVDYRGSTVSSYNKTVNLTSSNTKTLKVKDISVSSGTGSSTAKAGKKPGIAIIKANGAYVNEASVLVKVYKVIVNPKKAGVYAGKMISFSAQVLGIDFPEPDLFKWRSLSGKVNPSSGSDSTIFTASKIPSKHNAQVRVSYLESKDFTDQIRIFPQIGEVKIDGDRIILSGSSSDYSSKVKDKFGANWSGEGYPKLRYLWASFPPPTTKIGFINTCRLRFATNNAYAFGGVYVTPMYAEPFGNQYFSSSKTSGLYKVVVIDKFKWNHLVEYALVLAIIAIAVYLLWGVVVVVAKLAALGLATA